MRHRLSVASLIAAAAAVLVVAVLRIAASFSGPHPSLLMTSGLEEEALYSLWNTIHGTGAYLDVRALPFSHSYFNWLFYQAYGAATGLVLRLFALSDGWIPEVAHGITLALALAGAGALAASLRRFVAPGPAAWPLAAAGAAIAFFGPLTGFWIVTARPDVGALGFEVFAFLFGVRYFRDGRTRDLWYCLLLALAACAFKQTAIVVLASALAGLALRRDWHALGLALLATAIAIGIPFAVLGENYYVNAFLIHSATPLAFEHGVENIVLACAKAPVVPCGFVAVAIELSRTKIAGETAFALGAFALSLLLAVLSSAKIGASQNYYFLPCCLAVWWLFRLEAIGKREAPAEGPSRTQTLLFWMAMAAQAAGATAIFAGAAGRIDIRRDAAPYEQLQRSLPGLPGPVLVLDRPGNLPWIQATPPHIVFGFVYDTRFVRDLGYRDGGIEGLLAAKRIRTMAIPKKIPPSVNFPVPGHMALAREDEYFAYYTAREGG